MKLLGTLALSIVLLQCALAQIANRPQAVNVGIRPKRSLQDAEAARPQSDIWKEILEGYRQFKKIVLEHILKENFRAKMNPVFEGTSGMDDVRLARWWQLTPVDTPWEEKEMDRMIRIVNALAQVDIAYKAPAAAPPGLIAPAQRLKTRQIPPLTPDFTPQQQYFLPAAQGGFDFNFAQTQPGGLGDGITVFDIEFDWNAGFTDGTPGHEDLPDKFLPVQGFRYNPPNTTFRAHGTSVAGIVGGDDNTFGVKGIAPNATFAAIGVTDGSGQGISIAPQSIMRAVDRGRPGDIILLEVQYSWNITAERKSPERFVPIEWFPAEFDAIASATRRGFVVIEAAANGHTNQSNPVYFDVPNGQNLDDPIFIDSRRIMPGNPGPNPFDERLGTSGAVLVGAGAGRLGNTTFVDRSRLDFPSYGARVDVQAWGENVASSGSLEPTDPGYCDLTPIITDTNRCYTNTFSGTSSASAIIAGLAASVQGILRARGLKPLTPAQFRALFRDPNSGFPQNNGDAAHPATQTIGSRPDMSKLIPKAIALTSPAPNIEAIAGSNATNATNASSL